MKNAKNTMNKNKDVFFNKIEIVRKLILKVKKRERKFLGYIMRKDDLFDFKRMDGRSKTKS